MALVPVLLLVLVLLFTVLAHSGRSAWAAPVLRALTLLLLASGAGLGLWWAPADQYMGEVQRIMYVHVPLVWAAMLAAAVTFVASLRTLWSGSSDADVLAESAAEVGLVLGFLGVLQGSIWGRPTWGVWWTWDPRMTSTVVMLTVLGLGLLLRRWSRDAAQGRTLAALAGCAQALALPLVVLSVRLWNTLHQLPSTSETMHASMMLTLRWNAVALVSVFLALLQGRLALGARREVRVLPTGP